MLSGEIALRNNHYYYYYDSDWAHLTSFGIEFQTEEEAKENERSPSVALLCACLLRRGMVCEVEREPVLYLLNKILFVIFSITVPDVDKLRWKHLNCKM